LTLAWDKGCRLLALESDSVVAVTLISNGCPDAHPCAAIVKLINRLMMRDWQ
ncbi:hypothetical protein A2U01_0074426, partial [Trifolium medium]|nr:hypothetical protein [Trifolium medium]